MLEGWYLLVTLAVFCASIYVLKIYGIYDNELYETDGKTFIAVHVALLVLSWLWMYTLLTAFAIYMGFFIYRNVQKHKKENEDGNLH